MAERKNKSTGITDPVEATDDKKTKALGLTTPQSGLTTPQSDALVEHVKKRPLTGRGGTQNFPSARVDETPDEARQILTEVIAWMKMPRCENDDEVEERVEYFFDKCTKNGERPTVEKLCLALGTTRDTLYRWEIGERCSARRSNIIKQAKIALSAYDAGLAITGKMNPVPYIFRAKNYYGMKDEQEVVLTPNNPLGNATDENEIARKYAQLPEE